MTKLLVLRSAEIFFPKGEHIYKYLAKKFGKLEEYDKLDKAYQDGKINGPCFLQKTVETVLKGEQIGRLVEFSISYIEEFFNPNLKDFLEKVRSKDYEIAFFCSFPRIIFLEANYWLEFGVNYIYGVVNELDEETKIIGIKPLEFQDEEFVKKEMKRIGFGKEFTTEPNRFGMLGKLIELKRDQGFKTEDVILLTNSITNEPQMKVVWEVIKNSNDLEGIVKKL